MSHFQRVQNTMGPRPIAGCPGRWVLDNPAPDLDNYVVTAGTRFESEAARDPVWLTRLMPQGALLSYERPDGTYLHTLNTHLGLARKCSQLGIDLLLWEQKATAVTHVDEPADLFIQDFGADRK